MIPPGKVPAPEFGHTWINSPGLTLAELRGRVVLIDFWDYTCINCLRTLPYILEWHQRYQEKGLAVIGVHAPEFSFARRAEHIRNAVAEFGITYPVVLDNDYQIMRAYENRCWPAKYLADKDGFLRFLHFGEGAYPETEAAIQELLRQIDPGVALPALLPPLRESDRPGTACHRVTPELYLGYRRGHIGNPKGFRKDKAVTYTLPENLLTDVSTLEGRWLAKEEFLESAPSNGQQPARLELPYLGKELNLVMAPVNGKEFTVQVRQDGGPLEREDAGQNLEYTDQGQSVVRVREPKMYRLVANAGFGPRRLTLEVSEAGLGLYAFTFVSCPAD